MTEATPRPPWWMLLEGPKRPVVYSTDEDLDRAIKSTGTPCAAPCGVPLTALNLINEDPVHEDCRCFYRDCRTLLLEPLDWQRRICETCWVDPLHNVEKVELRNLPGPQAATP